jgi:hypothetical protein
MVGNRIDRWLGPWPGAISKSLYLNGLPGWIVESCRGFVSVQGRHIGRKLNRNGISLLLKGLGFSFLSKPAWERNLAFAFCSRFGSSSIAGAAWLREVVAPTLEKNQGQGWLPSQPPEYGRCFARPERGFLTAGSPGRCRRSFWRAQKSLAKPIKS